MKSYDVFQAIAECVEKVNADRNLMTLVITTLDGILTGNYIFYLR